MGRNSHRAKTKAVLKLVNPGDQLGNTPNKVFSKFKNKNHPQRTIIVEDLDLHNAGPAQLDPTTLVAVPSMQRWVLVQIFTTRVKGISPGLCESKPCYHDKQRYYGFNSWSMT